MANGPDFEWDLKSESPAILNPDKWQTFVKNHLKSRQKHPDFKWSGFQMVVTIAIAIVKAQPFEIRPSKSPFHMVGFQIPTVFGFLFCFDDYLYIYSIIYDRNCFKSYFIHFSDVIIKSILMALFIIAHILMTSFFKQGQDDSERYLTDLGREQADLTGKRLAEMVKTSPKTFLE